MKWEFDEVFADEARSQLFQWNLDSVEIFVPGWFVCEFTNVLFQRCRRGDMSVEQAGVVLQQIARQTHEWIEETALGSRAIEIALASGQKASYDSFYVAFAEHLGCDLWTADERFWRSTNRMYPCVRWIGNLVIDNDPR